MGVAILRISPEQLDLVINHWPAATSARSSRFDLDRNQNIIVIEGPSIPQCDEVEMLIETEQGSAEEYHQVKKVVFRPVTPFAAAAPVEWFEVAEITRFQVVKHSSTTTDVERLGPQYPNQDIPRAVAAALNEHILEKHHG